MVDKRPVLVLSGLLAAALASPLVATAASAAPDSDWLPATPANWNLLVDKTSTPPVTVTHGVTEHAETYDTVGGRQPADVLEVNLADPNVRLGVVEAGNTITDPADETVGSMAARTGAVAGVNGDYFEINASGRPLGGVISNGQVLKSPRANYNAQLGVRPDGSMVMGPETFTGTLADGTANQPLNSINVVNDEAAGGITEITPAMGAATGLTPGALVAGHQVSGGLVVDSVRGGVTALPALTGDQEDLFGAGAGGAWLTATVHRGDTIGVTGRISPDDNLTQLVSGATMLVRDGQVYTDPTGTPPSGVNPETAVGLSQDGRHAIIVTLDGRSGESTALGVTPAQVAGYLVAHGAYTGELFDGGGSTEMVSRLPGAAADTVRNIPSDGKERPVANGIFIYTNETTPGPATAVTVNQGKPVTTVTGAGVPVPVYATDSLANPAADRPSVQVIPSSLGSWANGTLSVRRAGTGVIVARAGRAVSVQPLRVVDRLAARSVTARTGALGVGRTARLTATGTEVSGDNLPTVSMPVADPAAHRWSSAGPRIATVDPDSGVVTAHHAGAVDISLSSGGLTGSTPIVVSS
jgi:exopolysaccharide biosynthesis protein